MFKENRLKRRMAAGERAFGIWLQTAEPTFAELAGLVGYDVLILDNEHGPADLQRSVEMMRAAEAAGADVLVRVPWNDPVYLKRILDAGAASLMIPMVESAEEARAAVAACRYPPRGSRGYSASTARASSYGLVKDYLARADDEMFIAVQIESEAAVGRAGEIAAVEGVDMVFIGPNDLAGSIGLLERLHEPAVDRLIRRCEQAVRGVGKSLGTVPRPEHGPERLLTEAYQLVAASTEMTLFREAARAEIARVKAAIGK